MSKIYARFFKLSYFLLLLSSLTSCYKKEDFNFKDIVLQNLDYDLALPLITTRLTLGNLIGEIDMIQPDSSGLLHFVYSSDIQEITLSDMVVIPDMNVPPVRISNIPYFKKDTLIKIQTKDSIAMEFGPNMEVDKMWLERALLSYNLSSSVGATLSLRVEFSNFLDSLGKPLVLTMKMDGQGSESKNLDLSSYVLDFSSKPGRKDPTLYYTVTGELDLSTATNEFPNIKTGDISMAFSLKNLQFERVEGYFGYQNLANLSDVIDMTFDEIDVNRIMFEEAYVKMGILNGASIPVRIENSKVSMTYKNYTSETIDLLPDNFNIPYPAPNQVPMEQYTQVKSNNLSSILTNIPKRFSYELKATLNPDDNKNIRNVLNKDSRFAVDFSFDIPIYCAIDGYKISDTFPMAKIPATSAISKFDLLINLKNAFPVDLNFEVNFLDSNNQLLLHLIPDHSIKGAKIGNQGHVVEPTNSVIGFALKVEDISKLDKVRKISLNAKLSTTDIQKVRFYVDTDEGFLDAKMGARLKLKIGNVINLGMEKE